MNRYDRVLWLAICVLFALTSAMRWYFDGSAYHAFLCGAWTTLLVVWVAVRHVEKTEA